MCAALTWTAMPPRWCSNIVMLHSTSATSLPRMVRFALCFAQILGLLELHRAVRLVTAGPSR
jgi:hypothetical protein